MASSKLFFAKATILILISFLIAFNFSNKGKVSVGDPEVLPLPGGAIGPESLVFDKRGEGPYTGIWDGRIIKWEKHENRWVDFAVTSRNRKGCEDPNSDRYKLEPICGRPLGLCFNEPNGDLYIADAYMGLLKVGPKGGLATTIATESDSIPFKFTNSLDIDQSTSAIYFTDSSSIYQRRDYVYAILSGDTSGRLMRYDLKHKKVKVVLNNLSFPNGVVLSKDGNYILIAETTTCKILKYWIKTSKVGTVETFAQLPGFPDNIKRSPRGGYWVAIHSKRNKFLEWILSYPWIGDTLAKLPFNIMKIYSLISKYRGSGMGVWLDENGEILKIFEDKSAFKSLSEVMEVNGKLLIGSIQLPFVGMYSV